MRKTGLPAHLPTDQVRNLMVSQGVPPITWGYTYVGFCVQEEGKRVRRIQEEEEEDKEKKNKLHDRKETNTGIEPGASPTRRANRATRPRGKIVRLDVFMDKE